MNIVFLSNYMNHHQLPLSKALCYLTQDNYTFVSSEEVPSEKILLGYHDMNKEYPFVLTTYDNAQSEEVALELVRRCDIAITGSAPEKYTKERIKKGKLTFRYSERLFKRGFWERFAPHKMFRLLAYHRKYRNDPLYMLCASAYAAADYKWGGAYREKTYKWGYFPEVKRQDMDILLRKKHENEKIILLWVGRLIHWKHPEAVIWSALRLKKEGYNFELRIVGRGKKEHSIHQMIKRYDLGECVHLLGSMPPESVREHMEQADIFLFTSDFHEGWGAVLNEAMNSGCAVIASHAIGSVPFLIRNGENGLIYENGNLNDLYAKIKRLIQETALREYFGRAAYQTLIDEWNADIAAERFLILCEAIQEGKETPYLTGPCSRAEVLKNNWFRNEI